MCKHRATKIKTSLIPSVSKSGYQLLLVKEFCIICGVLLKERKLPYGNFKS